MVLILELRPYQIDIINQAVNSDKSTLIQVPTGGGKTVIAREIIVHLVEKLGQQVLFVAPKIILMEQTAKVFDKLDPYTVHGSNSDHKNHKILVSTIQTASRRDINPDVIIIDEVHFGFDGKMLEALLKDKPDMRIIGLSATPYDQNGKLLQGFDLILNHYDMKYMIENGYLVNLQSKKLVKIMNLDKVNVTGGDYNLKALSKIMCTNRTVLEIVDTTGEYIYQYKKTIVFAVDIDHSELLAQAYRERGFVAKAVHSKLSKGQAQQRIKAFEKGEIKILVSVAMLTTGFDVPDADIAIIARPTKSQNLYKQMVGRVLRTADGKTHALLLDCGNVIDNLGMPLEPIQERQSKENTNTTKKCESCESDEIGLIHKDDKFFWECKKCKHLQPIERDTYECKICKRKYVYNAKLFSIRKSKLFLDCEDCPYPTLISEYTGQEVLISLEQERVNIIENPQAQPEESENKEEIRLSNEKEIREVQRKYYQKNQEATKFEREVKDKSDKKEAIKKQIKRIKTIDKDSNTERNAVWLENRAEDIDKLIKDVKIKADECKKEAMEWKAESERLTRLVEENCYIKLKVKKTTEPKKISNIERNKTRQLKESK